MIGGIMTPAGTSLNLLTMDLLDQLAGMNITFVQWMFVGIPIAVVLLPIAWFAIIKVYKPAEVGQEKIQKYLETIAVPDKIEKKEALVMIITLGMLAFWIASSWLPFLDVTIIALLGFVCYFLPGVEVLTWKEFVKSVSWEAFPGGDSALHCQLYCGQRRECLVYRYSAARHPEPACRRRGVYRERHCISDAVSHTGGPGAHRGPRASDGQLCRHNGGERHDSAGGDGNLRQ